VTPSRGRGPIVSLLVSGAWPVVLTLLAYPYLKGGQQIAGIEDAHGILAIAWVGSLGALTATSATSPGGPIGGTPPRHVVLCPPLDRSSLRRRRQRERPGRSGPGPHLKLEAMTMHQSQPFPLEPAPILVPDDALADLRQGLASTL
jgi:hypothetical protein